MDNNEVKSAVETLGKTFESFKKANDERLVQIEKKGSSDPITEDKLSKIDAELDKFADKSKWQDLKLIYLDLTLVKVHELNQCKRKFTING